MTDDPDDDVLEARPIRIRRWHIAAIGIAVLAFGAIQVVRHTRDHEPLARTTPQPSVSATPAGRVIEGQALLSNVVGNRCPTSVVCGVGATVSGGMAATFRADFPNAAISLQASAFDAGKPRTYWQQISATAAAGVSIVLTEQRLRVRPTGPAGLVVNRSLDGQAASVSINRAGWQVIANLTGTGTLPVTAARRWVTATPLPQ